MASPQSKLDRFKCEVCDQKFANFLIKKEHLEKQHNFLVCFMPQCGKRHKSAREMQTHFLKSHSVLTATSGDFKCQNCSQRFKTALALRRHTTRVHYGLKSKFSVVHYCSRCDQTFTNPRDLQMHSSHKQLITDTNHCTMADDCDFETTNILKMRKHMGTHPLNLRKTTQLGREKFKCPNCVFSCNVNQKYQRHLSKKTNCVKPFTCPGCGKAFTSKKTMKKHQKNPCALTKLTSGLQKKSPPPPPSTSSAQDSHMDLDDENGEFEFFVSIIIYS